MKKPNLLLRVLQFFVIFFTSILIISPVFQMFILNALCCASEERQNAAPSKSKLIRKVLTQHSDNNQRIDSPSPIEKDCKRNSQQAQSSASETITPNFVKFQTPDSITKSVECNPGTDFNSLEEQMSDCLITPVNLNKTSSIQKENDPFSNLSKKLYDSDFNGIDVKQWSTKDVLKFLTKVGMKIYNTTFYKNKIKGKDLISLNEKELKQDLEVQSKDIKTLIVYIQVLKQRSERQQKQKSLSKTFSGKRRKISLYKTYENSYSTRKILTAVKNPIQQDSQEDLYDHEGKREIMTTKQLYSTSNLSELLTN